MSLLSTIPKFINNDKKLILRDNFSISMLFAGIGLAIILKYLLPWADAVLIEKGYAPSDNIPFALHELYPMLIPFMVLYNGSMISGMMSGFLMLDEKDERTLIALGVTPVPLYHYTLYRFGLAALFSFILLIIMLLIIDLVMLPMWQMLLFCAAGSLFSILAALFLVITADNKVQGFAMGKFLSIGGWVMMVGWFIPPPWQWFAGIFPPFFVHKAYWMALEGEAFWWLILALSTILQIITIYLMNKKYTKMVFD